MAKFLNLYIYINYIIYILFTLFTSYIRSPKEYFLLRNLLSRRRYYLFIFKMNIGIELMYNVVLISGTQHSDSVILAQVSNYF